MEKEVEERIFISLKEYKELLIIKGKYEELKQFYTPLITDDKDKTYTNWLSQFHIPHID